MKQRIITLARKCSTLLFLTLLLAAVSVTRAAGNNDTTQFPQENLVDRIRKIEQLKQVKITFDETMVTAVMAPALTASRATTAGELLKQSLRSSKLAYKKYGESNYSIIQKAENVTPEVPDETKTGKGSISGMVLDEAGESLTGATIVVVGTTLGAVTDLNGQYTLKQVPAGTHTIEARFISYQTQQVTGVQVTGGKTTRLDLVLQPADEELGEVVVKAGYKQASAEGLYARQQSSMQLVDGISADLMKRTGDNNIAQVLGRVSGVTISKGKYVTVRGMSDRYNNVLLNGASLPSTEPNRRNFSFDVIPSALVDNVTVAKTFTPDMPGEFVGGLVEVNTLAVPDEQFLTVTAGTGMNTNSTGKDFLSNTRYSGDWLFGDIDSRQWYAGGSEEQVDMGIANAAQKNNYGLRRYTAAPVQNYELSVGLPFALGENQRLGVVAALSYRNQQTIEDILETHTITRDSLWQESWRNKFVTATGAVLNMGWESPNQQITWRNLFNNRFSHTNQERYMNKYYEGYDIVEQYSVPLQSRLWQTQLEGEHKLAGNLKANWNLSYSKVTRTNPDDRLATARVQGYMADGSPAFNWSLATSNTNIQTIIDSHTMYSRLEESKKNAGFDLEYRFKLHQLNQKLKLGYLGSFRKASFEQQYLKAQGGNTEAYGLPVQDYFAPENFGDSGFLSYSRSGLSTSHADYYQGEQNIHAAYLMGELTPMAKLHFTLGSRMEKAKTSVTTLTYRDDGGGRTDSLIVLNKTSWLPAASLVYNVTSNFNARLAWSQTLARPDFRELSLNTYYNVDDRVSVYNQGAIKQSSTDNYDFRLEWYPHPGEVISAGLFYKKFSDPVEIVTRMTSSQQSFYMYPVNIDEATAKGVELNLRKSLGFMAPGSLLENLYFSGNFSLIEGDVTYSLADVLGLDRIDRQERSRPLAGLAPYLVNGGLSYEGKVFGWSVNYNREGRKLVYAGEYDKHDQYENPRDVLDLQVSARLLRQKLELKLNAGDILNQDVIIYRNCDYDPLNDPAVDPGVYHDRTGLGMDYNEGDWLMSRVKKGVNLSFSVSYKL